MDINLNISLDGRAAELLERLLSALNPTTNALGFTNPPEVKQAESTPPVITPVSVPPVEPPPPKLTYTVLLEKFKPRRRTPGSSYWDHPFFDDVPRKKLYDQFHGKNYCTNHGFPTVWVERVQQHQEMFKAFTLSDICFDGSVTARSAFTFLLKNKRSLSHSHKTITRKGMPDRTLVFYPSRVKEDGTIVYARTFPAEPLFHPKAAGPVRSQHNPNHYSGKDEAMDRDLEISI